MKRNRKTKFIFVTGGVLSSLGKGIVVSVLGNLLEISGFKIKIRKLEPYINIDPGTMNPLQHGEVYVTADGTETDLDIGHYERFTNMLAKSNDVVSTGQIYSRVIGQERKGKYLGETVQVIPHITDEIKKAILDDITEDINFAIYEIGGTVGDIEGLPFIEAIRQFSNDIGRKNVLYLHLTLIPFIKHSQELKTKPSQHSVRQLLSMGIQPNLLLCRSEIPIPLSIQKKLGFFCNIETNNVITALDVDNIYKTPIVYHKAGLDSAVLRYFHIKNKDPNLTIWEAIEKKINNPKGNVTIAVVGKYIQLKDAYKSLNESIQHAGIENNIKVDINWIDSELLMLDEVKDKLSNVSGIIVPGGYGERGTTGKLLSIKFARENKIPFLGICFGMQLAVIDFARHVLSICNANSTEFNIDTPTPVIGLVREWKRNGKIITRTEEDDKGGTMRLGEYPCKIHSGTLASKIYKQSEISERHRHRYEMNIKYKELFEQSGLIISGISPDGILPEIIELKTHPWFIGVQFHPEFQSKPTKAHPLFLDFIKTSYFMKLNNC